MILVELFSVEDGAPSIYEASQPHVLRLAVVEAYRAVAAIPATVRDAVAYLRDHSTRLAAFYTIEEAGLWAESYQGENGQLLKFIVMDFQVTQYDEQTSTYRPALKGVI
jgi:hypothetical protein